jgi:molybdate transport system ATP-binding protein
MLEISDLVVRAGKFNLIITQLMVNDGDWLIITGRSGSGKTLLLETIAGFYSPDSGSLILNGNDITRLPPEKREISIVFQDYSLFPHMNVKENISFGLRMKGTSGIEVIVSEYSKMLGIESLLFRRPSSLSGGEKQRVAIARALAVRPRLLLLDEPAGALDPLTRKNLWNDIRDLYSKGGLTIIHVTHDMGEAESLGNKKIIIEEGRIVSDIQSFQSS